MQDEFGDFYRTMFARQTEAENGRAVFLEYAWDMAWCDPCAADPLSPDELRRLGVFWLGEDRAGKDRIMPGVPHDVFVTRLHVSYDREDFPEDLVFLRITSYNVCYTKLLRQSPESRQRC